MDLVYQDSGAAHLSLTKQELFVILKQFNVKSLDKKLNFLEEHLENLTNSEKGGLKPLLKHFRSEFKNRWESSHRKESVFVKNNTEWLINKIKLPKKPSKAGRPVKEFDDLCTSAKRKKTQHLRSNVTSNELCFATQMALRAQGNIAASNILQEISVSPDKAKTLQKKAGRVSPRQLSGREALSMFVEANLSRSQYDIIQQTDKKRFPCYKVIQKFKLECYPSSESITVTATYAEVKLQALLDHTASRLCEYLSDIFLDLTEEQRHHMVMISKWGCDGSQQTRYKQKIEEGEDDSNIFLSSMMPLRLQTVTNDGKVKIIWQNPVPSSPRFCRPIRIRFIHESVDVTKHEIDFIRSQIQSVVASEIKVSNASLKINHQLLFTMVDGKICNAATDTKSTMRCYVCGQTSKDFNSLIDMPEDTTTFEFSTLHARIRFFEFILHLSYKLPVKKWQIKLKEDQELVKATKTKIQEEFKSKLGLLLDIPKAGFGSTNDGNTARRFFANSEISAEITKVDLSLIKRLAVILEVISSGQKIDTVKFAQYTRETAELYVSLYPWLPMTPTVHKILQHGPTIIGHALLPIGQLSEEAAEARNKHFRDYRLNFSRKCSRQDSNRDVLNRLLLTSDPLLSSIRAKKSRSRIPFSKEALNMLTEEDAPDSDDSDVDKENDED